MPLITGLFEVKRGGLALWSRVCLEVLHHECKRFCCDHNIVICIIMYCFAASYSVGVKKCPSITNCKAVAMI